MCLCVDMKQNPDEPFTKIPALLEYIESTKNPLGKKKKKKKKKKVLTEGEEEVKRVKDMEEGVEDPLAKNVQRVVAVEIKDSKGVRQVDRTTGRRPPAPERPVRPGPSPEERLAKERAIREL